MPQPIVKVFVLAFLVCFAGLSAAAEPRAAAEVLRTWHKFALELTRHTATYSPPVASRTFAYLGITGFEAAASGAPQLKSLAGQLNGLSPTPEREAGKAYDEGVVVNAALAAAVSELFNNTGPTGQRALQRLTEKLTAEVSADIPVDMVERSEIHGRAVAAHILAWARQDGGAEVANMGFPAEYTSKRGSGLLDADKSHPPAADAAPARLGQEPGFRHAGRRVLPAARPSGL